MSPGHPLVAPFWEQLLETTELDDVLEWLVARPDGASSFAVLLETGAGEVVARGDITVALDADQGVRTRQAGGGIELALGDVSAITVCLAGDGSSEPALPLTDGVAAASGFRVVLPPHVRRASSSEETLPTVFTGGRTWADDARTERPDPAPSGQERLRSLDVSAPRVLAARCPVGHLTAAYSDVCRVCRRKVAAQRLVETPRPVLGRLVLPGGESVPLVRGAVLGRAPYIPADWVGAEPDLVSVADPDHDVSTQHVSVTLDLWNVLVCDLGSTNGTHVLDQDGRRTQLRPYQPSLLRPGCSLVLADVVTVRFEALP